MKKLLSQKTMSNSMKNTRSNTAHRVTDLRKRILSIFAGLIEDRRFDIMRPPSLNSRSTAVVVAGMQLTI